MDGLWIHTLSITSLNSCPLQSNRNVSPKLSASEVIPISVANTVLDPDTGEQQFPDQAGVAKFRSLLTVHSGMPIKRLLAEQDVLYPAATQELARPKTPGTATVSQQPAAEKSPTAHPHCHHGASGSATGEDKRGLLGCGQHSQKSSVTLLSFII
jgi:hypothetical protein